jgi:hypothetical protein
VRYDRRESPGFARGLFKGFVIGFCLLPSLIGLLVIWHVLIATKRFDDGTELTNRVARATYFWFAISRPEDGAPLYPWLRYDLKEFLQQDPKQEPKAAPEPPPSPKPDQS